MNEGTFRIKSSDGSGHLVQVEINEERARVTCTCKAAQNVMLCKHRLSFLTDDPELLLDPEIDGERFHRVCERLRFTAVFGYFDKMQADINDLMLRKKLLDKEIARCKTQFAHILTFGT